MQDGSNSTDRMQLREGVSLLGGGDEDVMLLFLVGGVSIIEVLVLCGP